MARPGTYKRFKTVYEQRSWFTTIRIIEDEETGVQYLLALEGHAGGLSVLVDREGLPIMAPEPDDRV